MTAVRHAWMFRTAAVMCLLLGASAVWRFGLTDYDPSRRLWGLGGGALTLIVGLFLFRYARFAIGLSAIGAGFVGICAAVAAPIVHGPVILAFAGLAILLVFYAVMAARVLFDKRS